MEPVYRTLTLRGATGKLRAARLQDKDYLVVPVTALVEAVIHPLGSKGRGEFVSRKVLKQSVDTWNGRPCVPDHPMDAMGRLVSANLPAVFEQQSFGMTFNSQFVNDRELHMEAWLDPIRAEVVGAKAMDVINKVRADQPVEVSVGGYVAYVEKAGSHGGQEYGVEWMQITSDHLALGLSGGRGACSVEMGCGAMRGNAEDGLHAPIYVITPSETGPALVAAGWEDQPRNPAGQWIDSPMSTQQVASLSHMEQWRAKVMSLLKSFSFRANQRPEDMSDSDLREQLQGALSKKKASYCQVVHVYPKQNRVVFVQDMDPQGMGDIRWFRQEYSLSKDGKADLEGDAEPVRSVQSFEAMSDEPVPETTTPDPPVEVVDETKAAGACGCHKTEEQQMHRNADKIKGLIEDPTTPFTADDQTFLEGLTDDRLGSFLTPRKAEAAPVTPPVVTPPVVETPVVEPKALSLAELAEAVRKLNDAEFTQLLPEEARAHVVAGRAQAKERRDKMLSGLKAATKDAYTAEELAALSTDQLDKLAKAVGFDPEKASEPETPVVEDKRVLSYDFSGMGGARQMPEGTKLSDFTPPDPYKDALAARKGA